MVHHNPSIICSILLTFFIFACKKEAPKVENVSGAYILIRHGYSYWCETYKSKAGKDSIAYFGDYSFLNQPDDMKEIVVSITKNNIGDYFICLQGNCSDSLFNPKIKFLADSVDFGSNFKIFSNNFTVLKMKGVKNGSGFKGIYVEYGNQPVPSSANPWDHIFIGTFELIKK